MARYFWTLLTPRQRATKCNESEYDEDGEVDFDGYFVLTKEKREPMTLKNRLAMYPYYGE